MRTPEQSHASLQRELTSLNEKYTWDDAPAAVKRRIRTIKNRLSAKRSREQAREYVEKLEGSVKLLEDESDSLARRLAIVEAENKILKQVDGRRLNHTTTRDKDTAMGEAPPSKMTTTIEEEGQDEPAVPPKPSLQLDALLLLFQTVAASAEASPPSNPSQPPAQGELRQSTAPSAHGLSSSTSRLLRLRRTLSKLLTKQRIFASTAPSSQSPTVSPEARDRARRARVMRGLRLVVIPSSRQRSATPRAPRPTHPSDSHGKEVRAD